MNPPSRLRRFIHTLASSYMVTATTFAATLISTPLALHYLPNREFALWALLTQIVGYVTLADFGMSPALARLLIDHKDRPAAGEYGSLIQTGFQVSLAQGALILGGGFLAAPFAARLLDIPAELQATFISLIRWQLVITAGTFATRVLRHILHSQNRNDITNYGQILNCLVTLGLLWGGLRYRMGVHAVILANAGGLILSILFNATACRQLGFFPPPGAWGCSTWTQFRKLFDFGRDVFLVHLGSQLIVATQTVILANRLGLEAVAAWAVATKVYTVLCNLLWQTFDFSTPVLAEMMVRQDTDRLRHRFRHLLMVSMALATVAGVIFASTNSAFITLWTAGKITWPAHHDLWLGLWLLPLIWVHCHGAFVLLTKQLAALRYLYFVEGLLFVTGASCLVPWGGIPAMIATSILCSLAVSGWYSARRTSRYFNLPAAQLEIAWFIPTAKMLLILIPVAIAVSSLTSSQTALWQFIIRGAILGTVGAAVLYRFGIPAELRRELWERWR